MFVWTQDKLLYAAQMWRAGCTGAEIGDELGIGRGAVIGKLLREGVAGHVTPEQLSGRCSRAAARRNYA